MNEVQAILDNAKRCVWSKTQQYEYYKRRLESLNLGYKEYEAAVIKLAKTLNI